MTPGFSLESRRPDTSLSHMADTRSKRILIVDDEPDVTELVSYQLRAKGFEAEALNNPTQCIAKIRTFQPDLIILDVMMPEISGLQLCRMLRADPKTKSIPVIFLTAKAEEADRLCVEKIENDYFISSGHPMTKEHYISFVALLTGDALVLRKLYPEWNVQTRIPCIGHGKLVWYCSRDGLFYQTV